MTTMTGTIQAKARTGKSIQLDDGNWYSAFNASQIGDFKKGDAVTFDYKENGRYKNIQGNVKADASAAPAASTGGASTGGRGSYRPYRANGEEGGFPIHPRAYERALDRRNAVMAASRIISAQIAQGKEVEDPAAEVVQLATYFEEYSTGDMDAKAMAEMSSTGSEE